MLKLKSPISVIRLFKQILIVLSLGLHGKIIAHSDDRFQPNWDSLDRRRIPSWFDEAKIGIFVHWGVFSVPSFGSEWFWDDWKSNASDYVKYVENNFPKGFSYQEFAKDFTGELFDPHEWADLFKKAGAKYVVLTSKHHDGFTMWPSKYSFSWNAKDIGPHRDIVGDVSKAVRDAGLTFGLYHSLYEWFNPMYLSDKALNFTSKEFVANKMIPEMKELIETYKPSVLWSDGDWEAYDSYWNSTQFLAWLYNDSPVKDTVVVNDRWGIDIPCKHGDFYSCKDRFDPGVLVKHKWENAMTIDKKSWGFRREAHLKDYLTTHELLETLARTVSCGGNILINVGPTKEGIIAPIFEERLLELGQWLTINGEAIYGSTPWIYQNDSLTSGVWFTTKSNSVYAIVLDWPNDNILNLRSVKQLFVDYNPCIVLLGYSGQLEWKVASELDVEIVFPDRSKVKSERAWVLQITK